MHVLDIRNKVKQNDIISHMNCDPTTKATLLNRVRSNACAKFLNDTPLGLEYLRVSGFEGDENNDEHVFEHLCKADVHDPRSKLFQDRLNLILDTDHLGESVLDDGDCF
jgi:hypothetical protein